MRLLSIAILSILLTGCGVQSIPRQNNQVEADWAEVLNQYKRRTDLIPNLVNTVKGYASHEKETLESVIEARSKATAVNIDASNTDPQKLQEFSQAQGAVSQALGRLMMVAERYPDLKANQNFLSLQAQLEGTENRIAIARRRYIDGVKEFNNLITVFPTSMTNSLFFKHEKRPQFQISEEETQAPSVSF